VHEAARVLRRGGVLVIADLDRPPRFGWLVDAYFRLGEPAHAREVIGDGLARLLRTAGFAVEREGSQGAVPMQILTARPGARGDAPSGVGGLTSAEGPVGVAGPLVGRCGRGGPKREFPASSASGG
jgi:SAM-dependent methyltransferase